MFFKRIFTRKRSYFFIVLIVGLQFISSCLQFRISDREVRKEFKDQKYKPSFDYVEFPKRKIHYTQIGKDSLPTLFFIHGSPGDWSVFKEYFKDSTLLSRANMVALDRTGYGKSNFGKGEKVLKQQSEYYKSVLEKYQNSSTTKPILVAHSYGGPVVVQMAIDYPDLVGGVVILAGLSSPEVKISRWYNSVAKSIFVRWWLPQALTVSNKEMLNLTEDLTLIKNKWKKIKVPVKIIHGKKDKIVPYEHALFAKEQLKHTSFQLITLDEANHFIPWTHQEIITTTLLEMLEEVEK